ncbi:Com family DNA-binding transcriptional regulator [Rhodovulum sp. PH10]|uniref:Com family DNA-binding transcriptional regulator n=1 Tax=Rhodovulum sp. PH10 TaxID=1187851 RepID=UPI0009FC0302
MAATPSSLWRAAEGWHIREPMSVEFVRCASCRALLFRADAGAIAGIVEIKCRRCGTFNVLRPTEPSCERRERQTSGEASCISRGEKSAPPHSISAMRSRS